PARPATAGGREGRLGRRRRAWAKVLIGFRRRVSVVEEFSVLFAESATSTENPTPKPEDHDSGGTFSRSWQAPRAARPARFVIRRSVAVRGTESCRGAEG